jgi:predicted metal-dependent hydrolase
MKVQWREFRALVRKHGGWIEDDMARFPSPHQKNQFEAELARSEASGQRHSLEPAPLTTIMFGAAGPHNI